MNLGIKNWVNMPPLSKHKTRKSYYKDKGGVREWR